MENFETKIFISPSFDIYENLAIENELLLNIEAHEKFLFFYVNSPCIVLGRFQNPFEECDLQKMQSSAVKLARRQSGGGTVYHDRNNLNYSFIHGSKDHHKDHNHSIILKALEKLGIYAESSGRSDLIVKKNELDFKFSGSAFKQKKDRSLHHGTLLIDSNLERLNSYLIAKNKDINSKSIKSNRSSVINLQQLNPAINQSTLIDSICREFNGFYNTHTKIEEFSDFDSSYYNQLKGYEWRFVDSPRFFMPVKLEEETIIIEIHKGVIVSIKSKHPYEFLINQSVRHTHLKDLALRYPIIQLLADNFVGVE